MRCRATVTFAAKDDQEALTVLHTSATACAFLGAAERGRRQVRGRTMTFA
jgi:hypothetical protein